MILLFQYINKLSHYNICSSLLCRLNDLFAESMTSSLTRFRGAHGNGNVALFLPQSALVFFLPSSTHNYHEALRSTNRYHVPSPHTDYKHHG
jgi:hypothetical protein